MEQGQQSDNAIARSDSDVALLMRGEELRAPSRELVLELERQILALPQVQMQVRHHFAPGLYARELTIPAGTVLTGKIHRHAHLCMISKGDITVLTENGMQRLKAPCTFISTPGIKRAGYAHEDTVFTTFHPTDETDLEKIEAMVVTDSFDEIDGPTAVRAITTFAGEVQ
jgi:hypothetical protein